MLPIRCFTCNKVLGQYNELFEKHKDGNLQSFFEKYEIKRYCCRKVFLTNVDITQFNAPYTMDNIVCNSVCETIKTIRAE